MANTLGSMRKALTLDTAADITKIAKLFTAIVKANPEVLKAQLSQRMLSTNPDAMVEFYLDMAEYIARDFDPR